MRDGLFSKTLGQGPSLLLLPGWGFNGEMWPTEMLALADFFKIRCVDFLRLDENILRKKKYDIHSVAEQIIQQVSTPAIWIGWSFGGLIALFIASRYPNYVKKVVTLAANLKFIKSHDWPGLDALVWDDFVNTFKINQAGALRTFVFLQGLDNRKSKILHTLIENQFKLGEIQKKTRTAALESGLEILKNVDLRDSYQKIVCPMLHVLGGQDKIVPVTVAGHMRNLNPNAEFLILQTAGHAPFLSHTNECLSKLRRFLM